MFLNRKSDFIADFTAAYAGYPDRVKDVEACYRAYCNAAQAPLESLLIGRIVRKDDSGKPLSALGIDDIERSNFGTSNEDGPGSVLWSGEWSLLLNDCWLLGGIHARLPFYLASPRTRENVIDPKYGLTVTGRELIGITTFGYRLHPNTVLGEVFECVDEARAASATLQGLEGAVRRALHDGTYEGVIAR